jgi:polypeptide N-acetylgalactosaminyltransferase
MTSATCVCFSCSEFSFIHSWISIPAHLKKPLEDYMARLPKVKILRLKQREGLIKARLRGVEVAIGPTLTFLDSHIECSPGWLEPLLDRIARNSSSVVSPVLDLIRDSDFYYFFIKTEIFPVGGFNWNLQFEWNQRPLSENDWRSNAAEPTRTPTIAGGLFTIHKAFFEKLGFYDPGFDIWGGENLELSFKTWMCGGTLEIIPCSHVGHVFR